MSDPNDKRILFLERELERLEKERDEREANAEPDWDDVDPEANSVDEYEELYRDWRKKT